MKRDKIKKLENYFVLFFNLWRERKVKVEKFKYKKKQNNF